MSNLTPVMAERDDFTIEERRTILVAARDATAVRDLVLRDECTADKP